MHRSIASALDSFVLEARALRSRGGAAAPGNASAAGDGPSSRLAAGLALLGELHRFLRAVCTFHTASEEEVRLGCSICNMWPVTSCYSGSQAPVVGWSVCCALCAVL